MNSDTFKGHDKRSLARAALFAAVALLGSRAAHADFLDGSTLYEICAGKGAERDDSLCLGYITGIADAFTELAADELESAPGVGCIPADATAQQVRDIVISALAANRETRPT